MSLYLVQGEVPNVICARTAIGLTNQLSYLDLDSRVYSGIRPSYHG